MTGEAELQVLRNRIKTINTKLDELSIRKWEIEDEIEALTKELGGVKKEASQINQAMWASVVARVRLEEVVKKEDV